MVCCLLTSFSHAQKQQGSLQGIGDVDIPSFHDVQLNIDAQVIQDVSTISSEVRFLLRPVQEAEIASSMEGTIRKIHYKIGERFKKGQALISLQCDVIEARLAAQNASVEQARLDYQSNKDLNEGNAVSDYEVLYSASELNEARALQREFQIRKNNCEIQAPFDGGVIFVGRNAHESVSYGEPLITVIDDSQLVMTLHVPSTWVNKINNGDTFTVTVDETKKTYDAVVVGVSPAIDPASKTIELRATITSNIDSLRPGMSGRANMDFSND